jgi:putative oxidoreductase
MIDHVLLLSRILISILFLLAGVNKIKSPSATRQYMTMYKMPFTGFFLPATILLEILGGLSIFLGFMTTIGAIVLFVFMIPSTLIFHRNFSDQNQFNHFTKNLAIMGGLLLLAAYGPGPFSLDQILSLQG